MFKYLTNSFTFDFPTSQPRVTRQQLLPGSPPSLSTMLLSRLLCAVLAAFVLVSGASHPKASDLVVTDDFYSNSEIADLRDRFGLELASITPANLSSILADLQALLRKDHGSIPANSPKDALDHVNKNVPIEHRYIRIGRYGDFTDQHGRLLLHVWSGKPTVLVGRDRKLARWSKKSVKRNGKHARLDRGLAGPGRRFRVLTSSENARQVISRHDQNSSCTANLMSDKILSLSWDAHTTQERSVDSEKSSKSETSDSGSSISSELSASDDGDK